MTACANSSLVLDLKQLDALSETLETLAEDAVGAGSTVLVVRSLLSGGFERGDFAAVFEHVFPPLVDGIHDGIRGDE